MQCAEMHQQQEMIFICTVSMAIGEHLINIFASLSFVLSLPFSHVLGCEQTGKFPHSFQYLLSETTISAKEQQKKILRIIAGGISIDDANKT